MFACQIRINNHDFINDYYCVAMAIKTNNRGVLEGDRLASVVGAGAVIQFFFGGYSLVVPHI